VSCPSASFCVAVDINGHALTYNGSSWSAPVSIDAVGLFSVSCPSSSFCAAVNVINGDAVTYNGSSWSAPVSIDSSGEPDGVSCASPSFCVAVDINGLAHNGRALTYNGSSWSAPVSIDPSSSLTSVSCVSPSFCVAVDNRANSLTYNGSSWSAPASTGALGSSSVSCPSSSFCAVVGNGGGVTFNGSSWSAPVRLGSSNQLRSVSCVSASFCVAVDNAGGAWTYLALPSPSNTGLPTISGEAQQGQTLTEKHGTWTNGPTSYEYQWKDCDSSGNNCTPIAGATGQTYTLTTADVGHTVRVAESATNAGGTGGPATSNATAVVQTPAVAPSNTSLPAISGTLAVGQTLMCLQGSWSGNPAPTFSYQWQRDTAGITGATSSTYTVQTADQGHTLTCTVMASNSAGQASATSAGVAIPTSSSGGGNGSGTGTTSTGSGGGAGSLVLPAVASLPVSHGTVHLSLQCVGSGECAGMATLTATGPAGAAAHGHHKRARALVLGSARFSITGGTSGVVTIHLNGAGQKLLRKAHGGLRVHLTLTGTASGHAVNESKTVRLTARRTKQPRR
jgi:hypothetical protein